MIDTRPRLIPGILALIAALLAGCGTTPAPAAPTDGLPAATATTPAPTSTAPEPAPTSGNPFVALLGPVTAPPGWTVQPCEGQGPFLGVSTGDEFPGSVELLHSPIEQREDVWQWMVEAGLEPGQPLDLDDPEQVRRAREVLHALRDDHMGVVEEDRGLTYPEGRSFVLLEPEEVQVGRLPGLYYGFAGVEEDGQTYERWLTYAALDGQNLYILTAFYDPGDTPGSLPSDEALLTLAPYLRDIVAGLRLPEG
ncbi:MAG TPA: hypothetical protein VLC52_11200 [Anaerolineae bacterium]|nr:hypothetical protein [Anaerolineae bacterium]